MWGYLPTKVEALSRETDGGGDRCEIVAIDISCSCWLRSMIIAKGFELCPMFWVISTVFFNRVKSLGVISDFVSHRYNAIWLLFTITGMSLALMTCVDRISTYYSWPYDMKQSLETNAMISFPDVTICNLFPFPTLGQSAEAVRQVIDELYVSRCFNDTELRHDISRMVSSLTVYLPFTYQLAQENWERDNYKW